MQPAKLPLPQVFPSILLPMFLAVVDVTIVAAALPAMATAFGDVQRVCCCHIAPQVAGP